MSTEAPKNNTESKFKRIENTKIQDRKNVLRKLISPRPLYYQATGGRDARHGFKEKIKSLDVAENSDLKARDRFVRQWFCTSVLSSAAMNGGPEVNCCCADKDLTGLDIDVVQKYNKCGRGDGEGLVWCSIAWG